jgi:hypothetical protein
VLLVLHPAAGPWHASLVRVDACFRRHGVDTVVLPWPFVERAAAASVVALGRYLTTDELARLVARPGFCRVDLACVVDPHTTRLHVAAPAPGDSDTVVRQYKSAAKVARRLCHTWDKDRQQAEAQLDTLSVLELAALVPSPTLGARIHYQLAYGGNAGTLAALVTELEALALTAAAAAGEEEEACVRSETYDPYGAHAPTRVTPAVARALQTRLVEALRAQIVPFAPRVLRALPPERAVPCALHAFNRTFQRTANAGQPWVRQCTLNPFTEFGINKENTAPFVW